MRISDWSSDVCSSDLTVETDMGEETRSVPLDGKLSTITGGLLFGAQWQLSERLYLDWWILGPSYGSANGQLTATTSLDGDEQQELRSEEHTSELQSLMRISYAVFCLKKKHKQHN